MPTTDNGHFFWTDAYKSLQKDLVLTDSEITVFVYLQT